MAVLKAVKWVGAKDETMVVMLAAQKVLKLVA
jgi:hypothetical protein